MMKTAPFLCLFCAMCAVGFAQEIPKRFPDAISHLDFSEEKARAFQERTERVQTLWEKINAGLLTQEQLSPEEKTLLDEHDETQTSYWGVIGEGCSWYCGGGPDSVWASSALPSYKAIAYGGENAHDLSFETAWVEGTSGLGTGESLTYRFVAESPRITRIYITNGYVKSEKAWRENARVRTLRVYIGDQPYADLELEDSRSTQLFEVAPIGRPSRPIAWTMRFEIREAYPGEKYQDVALTEIYFDGIDVHCFPAGTPVTLADGSTQPIESVQAGQQVMTFDLKRQTTAITTVRETAAAHHCEFVRIHLENGVAIVATPDHPFLSSDQKWVSCSPAETLSRYTYQAVSTLSPGLALAMIDGKTGQLTSVRVRKIEPFTQPQLSYTLVSLEAHQVFLVQGVIVGTETLSPHLLPKESKQPIPSEP